MAIEFLGIICLGLALALLWIARPLNGAKARFLNGAGEIPYALLVVFLLAGGVGGMILGFTG
jgi:hypothetical protein